MGGDEEGMRIAAPAEEEEEGRGKGTNCVELEVKEEEVGVGLGLAFLVGWMMICLSRENWATGAPQPPPPSGDKKMVWVRRRGVELCAENVLPQKRNRIFVTAMKEKILKVVSIYN